MAQGQCSLAEGSDHAHLGQDGGVDFSTLLLASVSRAITSLRLTHVMRPPRPVNLEGDMAIACLEDPLLLLPPLLRIRRYRFACASSQAVRATLPTLWLSPLDKWLPSSPLTD